MDFLAKIKKRQVSLTLFAIVVIGVFLRTYHFRDWLYFYPDQARDVMVVTNYLEGKSELPLTGFIAASTKFKLGAMYYYFQIISGYLFGARPETMAYPDLFFSILSIPLFYYLFSRYFTKNLSLALTFLYTISFYVIKYSRFAWNPNPIPFFALLFIIALWKFLLEEDRIGWIWVIALGIALGVGIQLHTLLLLLLPAVVFFVFIFLMLKNRAVWKKWVVVFALALILNISQIISEVDKNYANSKLFLKLFTSSSQNGKENLKFNLKLDVLGGSQSNAHIISGLGNKLDFDFLPIIDRKLKYKYEYGIPFKFPDYLFFSAVFLSVLFFFFGYGALIYYYWKETRREKKYLLGLLILYMFLSLIIMHPVMDSLAIRYYIHLVFAPFLFLGFFLKLIQEKLPRLYVPISLLAVVLLTTTNLITIGNEAKAHMLKNRSSERYVVLGEIEEVGDYIASQASNKSIYFFAEGKYMQNFIKPLTYILGKKDISIIRAKRIADVPVGAPIIMLGENSVINSGNYFKKYNIESNKNFGQLGVYIIKN